MKPSARLFLIFPSLALAASDSTFLASLKSSHGEYQWHSVRVVTIDLNRDGIADNAALGLRKEKAALVVKIARRSEQLIREIPVDAGKQFGICPGGEPRISVSLQSEAPLNALGENPEGYDVCDKCFELIVSGGDCEPLYFYWNTKAGLLSWWRA
jgi:hypothetical protein